MQPDSRVSVLDHALVLGALECFTIEVWLPEEEPWFLRYLSPAGPIDGQGAGAQAAFQESGGARWHRLGRAIGAYPGTKSISPGHGMGHGEEVNGQEPSSRFCEDPAGTAFFGSIELS